MKTEKLASLKDVMRALRPYYAVAAATTGRGITVERMKKLMAHLGNPEKRLKVIHVAGTSGKTSTAYYTSALLSITGKKVGLTVSPHVTSLCERVQVGGQPLSEKRFVEHMNRFLELIQDAPETPSWFECMAAFAFYVFAEESVDYAVVETGLGGLHDATNVCDRVDKLCVITDIGLDHQAILGDDLMAIAVQKAGIIHEGNSVLMYEQPSEVMQAVRFKESQSETVEVYAQDQATLKKAWGKGFVDGLPDFQKRNWLLAYAAYRFLANRDGFKLASDQTVKSTQKQLVPGRMQKVTVGATEVIFDGAHNQPKMAAFIKSFEAAYKNQKVPVLIAMKQDKDAASAVKLVAKVASAVIVTKLEVSQDLPIKSINPTKLAKLFKSAGVSDVTIETNALEAYRGLLRLKPKLAIVTGSLYLVSQLLEEAN